MNEKELRAIDPKTLETEDIKWSNGTVKNPYDFTGRVLFDYDMGLSILDKEDTESCLTGINGPAYKGMSNYSTKERYHENLNNAITMIKAGHFKGRVNKTNDETIIGHPSCSFT